MRMSSATREAIEGYLYIAPWLVGFAVFAVGPMLASIYLSLTFYKIITPPDFVGLDNYIRMFQDDLFWKSLWNTVYYAAVFVPVSIAGSLCCALLLNQRILGRTIFRAIYFLPSITPIVATAFLWLWIFQPNVGLANYLLDLIGIEGPRWLDDIQWSKPSLIVISLWGAVGGGSMLIFLAGLQGIPIELYESAEIDGAGSQAKFWRITIPLLSPSMFFNLVLGLIGAMQMFTLAFVATSGAGQTRPAGGPAYSTLFYVLNLYNHAFDYWEMGYASALAWFFFLILVLLTYWQLRLSRSWVYYEFDQGERW